MSHDVFISYANENRAVADQVYATLEENGIRCWIVGRDALGGVPYSEAIIDAIKESKLLLLIFSSHTNKSWHVLREVEGAVNNGIRILPFHIEAVEYEAAFEYYLKALHWMEASQAPLAQYLPRLVETVNQLTPHQTQSSSPFGSSQISVNDNSKSLHVVLLYKHNAQPDEQVVQLLEQQLTASGHKVFVDRHLAIGMKWAREIEHQLQEAEVVIPLLSETSVQSEMLAYEVETVREEAQRNNEKPRLLPVRLNFTGSLPEDLGRILAPLPSLLWQGPQDNQQLVSDVLDALQKPLTPPAALRPEELKPYEGGIPPGSPVYVARPIDEEFYDAIARRDSVVLVKGARQMGKTSVLARGLQRARELGYRAVLTDFQKFNASQLETADILYQALCGAIADELGLRVAPDVTWKSFRGPNQNFEHYMRTEVMAKMSAPLVWGLDEVDKLFNRPFASEVFGLLRSWHNARALDPDSPWSQLTLAIAHATEPHLFIADLNQSPFNVGIRLTLQDFSFEEVGHLNHLYGSPLKTEAEVARFVRVVGGQPFLVHRSLYEFARGKFDLTTLERQADREEGSLNTHLGRILLALAGDADLCNVVRNLLRGQPCTDQKSFYRLRSGGVLIGETMRDARLRCQMYATYLERHLL